MLVRSMVVFALLAAGCSDGEGDGAPGGGGGGATDAGSGGAGATTTSTGGGSTSVSSASGGGGGTADACPFPDSNSSEPEPRAISLVEGVVTTLDGDPVVGTEVQVCGRDLCLYGETNDAGAFAVSHDGTELDKPIVKVGHGLEVGKLGFDIPEDAYVVAYLPRLEDSGTPLTPGATATVAGVTLAIADTAAVALNLLDFSDPGEETLRAAIIVGEDVEAVAPGLGFDAIVSLGPHDTRFCPGATLSVDNVLDLPPGTEVDLHLYGLDVGQGFVTYGEWTRFAGGRVSDDGASIVSDAEAVPVLNPIAIVVAD